MRNETPGPSVGRQGEDMTAFVRNTAAARSSVLVQALFVALIGGMVIFAAGLAQSATLHDAAHDMRHGTGFPCH